MPLPPIEEHKHCALSEADVRKMFSMLSPNKNGLLSRRSVLRAMKSDEDLRKKVAAALHIPAEIDEKGDSRDVFEQVYRRIDTDGNDGLDVDELVAYFNEHQKEVKAGRGFIPVPPPPPPKASSHTECRMSRDEIAALFNKLRPNAAGEISRKDVIAAMQRDEGLRKKIAGALHIPLVVDDKDGSRDAFEAVYRKIDRDGSDGLDLEELVSHFEQHKEEIARENAGGGAAALGDLKAVREKSEKYMADKGVQELVTEMVKTLLMQQPADPLEFMQNWLQAKRMGK